MARGAEAKETITAKLLETFAGAFKYDKEIRIPIMENGEMLQIKCVLTCAKTNVDNGGDTAVPGTVALTASTIPKAAPSGFMNEPTAEEKKNVADLCAKLGLTPQ